MSCKKIQTNAFATEIYNNKQCNAIQSICVCRLLPCIIKSPQLVLCLNQIHLKYTFVAADRMHYDSFPTPHSYTRGECITLCGLTSESINGALFAFDFMFCEKVFRPLRVYLTILLYEILKIGFSECYNFYSEPLV